MQALLGRIAGVTTRRPRTVLALWLIALAAVVALSAGAPSRSGGDAAIPGTDSAAARALLDASFPRGGGASSPLVITTGSRAATDRAAEAVAEHVAELPGVRRADLGQRSRDGHTRLVEVELGVDPPDLAHAQAEAILDGAREAAGPAAQVDAAGAVGQKLARPESRRSELIGLGVAVVILLLVGGTVPAMLLPIVVAVAGLVLGLRTLALVGSITSLPTATTTLATMIGLGVGIDYALFLLARVRGFRADGLEDRVAIMRAMQTTGAAVLFAAATVAIALAALVIAGLEPVTKLGLAAALTVVSAVLAALTLMPAALTLLGPRIERCAIRRSTALDESAGWARWGRAVARRPAIALLLAFAILTALSLPALHLTLGSERPSDQPPSTTLRQASDRIAAAFGPGAAGPITVVARLDAPADGAVDPELVQLRRELAAAEGVAGVGPAELSRDRTVVRVAVTPEHEPGAAQTATLVRTLRAEVLPAALPAAEAHVGGASVVPIDLAERVGEALPRIVATVVGLAFLLLLLAFRSVLLPAKAALANLLSVGAAYGVLTAVFQEGWGAGLIGLDGPVPVVSFVPMLLFAVLFGLSMDYEVFLLSRVQELHHAGATDEDAIVRGLAATGRLITAAALIMVAVFASFVLSPDPTIKMFGVGLAVAIAVDATVVRCLLVPSAMLLIGRANWWLPAWLDRRLPRLSARPYASLVPRMPPTTDDLAAADDEVWAALLHADADALDAIADPELVIDHPVLGVATVDALLEALRDGALQLGALDLERRRLRITGELATSVAIVEVSGTRGGAPFRTRLRWVNTWRLAAAWVLVAASSGPLREDG